MRSQSAETPNADAPIEAYKTEQALAAKSFRARCGSAVQVVVGLYYLSIVLMVQIWSSLVPNSRSRQAAEIRFAHHILHLEEVMHRLKYPATARQGEIVRDVLSLNSPQTVGLLADALCVADRATHDAIAAKLQTLLPRVTPEIFQSLTKRERGCLHYRLRFPHLRENPELTAEIVRLFERTLHDQPAILIAGIARANRLPANALVVQEAARAYLQRLGAMRKKRPD